MKVDLLQPARSEAYDRFIRSHPHALFYHSWAYKEFLKTLIGCDEEYLVAFDGDEVRAALPLMHTGGDAPRIYNSLPFFGTSAGIIAADDGAYCAVARAYNDVARRPTTRSATIVGSQFGPGRDKEVLAHNHMDTRIAQLTPLAAEGDPHAQLMARFEPSARRNIRKATEAGVTVAVDPNEVQRLAELHCAGMAAIGGTPKTDRFFDLVTRTFKPYDDFDVYVARRDGSVIAALLVFYLGRTVEYFVPAVDRGFRELQPLALVVSSAMIEAARRGFEWWNWGGTWTTQTGVYRFKKKWGAIERRYSYYTQLNDETLRTWPREKLLATWPHFFVLPFDALTDASGES